MLIKAPVARITSFFVPFPFYPYNKLLVDPFPFLCSLHLLTALGCVKFASVCFYEKTLYKYSYSCFSVFVNIKKKLAKGKLYLINIKDVTYFLEIIFH